MNSPKFSVLLPTCNRLELAKDAIDTVRRQTYPHWELVVADNCSTEDVAGYVDGLKEPRIKYIRSDSFLPVTENWNRAINASSGDFVIMLGDDDGLTPGYFEKVLALLDDLGGPDFLYHGAYQFSFPGAVPTLPQGALTDVTLYQSILRKNTTPSIMTIDDARNAAVSALNMRAVYGFNMQYFLFSRAFIIKMEKFGPIFQGPFPDFYAANLAMLLADRIGLVPQPLVIIGISPKSYGFHFFNNTESTGAALLNSNQYIEDSKQDLREILLPGTNMNTSWLISVALLVEHFKGQIDLVLGVKRYRLLQIIHTLRGEAEGKSADDGFLTLWPQLHAAERAFALAVFLALTPSRLLPKSLGQRWGILGGKVIQHVFGRQYLPLPKRRPAPVIGRYSSVKDVFDGLWREKEFNRGSSK